MMGKVMKQYGVGKIRKRGMSIEEHLAAVVEEVRAQLQLNTLDRSEFSHGRKWSLPGA